MSTTTMPAHLSTDASNSASDSNSFANAGVPAPSSIT